MYLYLPSMDLHVSTHILWMRAPQHQKDDVCYVAVANYGLSPPYTMSDSWGGKLRGQVTYATRCLLRSFWSQKTSGPLHQPAIRNRSSFCRCSQQCLQRWPTLASDCCVFSVGKGSDSAHIAPS